MTASFILAWRTLLRGRFLPLLLAGVAATVALVPGLIRTDGTASGARELYLHSVFGGSVALVLFSVLCAACGHIARSRGLHRLSLAVIRPLDQFRAVAGVWCAYVLCAAIAIFAAAAAVYFRAPGGAEDCRHHISPVLPSPMSAAEASIDAFLADPSTPEAVRKAPRSAVLAHLAAAEADRIQPIKPGESMGWDFPAEWATADGLRLRVRFSAQFSVRAPFKGEFTFGGFRAVLSNDTQSVIETPLVRAADAGVERPGGAALVPAVFRNTGGETVMLRPRQDLSLLAPADSFAANLLRAAIQSLSGVALAAAFGLFLSSALSRPVAVFTALVSVAVISIVPGVIDQFPDGAGLSLGDRIGVMLSRGVHAATHSLTDASPVSDLAEGRCVEWPGLLRAVLFNALLLPASLLGLASRTLKFEDLNS